MEATNGKVAETVESPQPEEVSHPAQQYPGVVVLRIPTDKPGEERLEIMPINGMDNLAVTNVLELAILIHRKGLGL